MRKCQDAGCIDEQARSLVLEVERFREFLRTLVRKVPDNAERWGLQQRIFGQHAQERTVRGRGFQQPLFELFSERLRAIERPQVEKNRGIEKRFGFRIADPGAEVMAPLIERHAPLWVARHDVSLAQREAAGIETLIDQARERDKGFAQQRSIAGLFRLEHDAVVLIGGERLLEPPLGAEGEPAPRSVRQLDLVDRQLDDARS